MKIPAMIVCFVCLCSASLTSTEPYRILAFGDSNTWGWVPNGSGTRYVDTERWAGILQAELGKGYHIIADGLVARRTTLDGNSVGLIEGSFLNGAKTLPPAIARHAPIDLVLIFLGTNDLQAGAERTADEIAAAVGELAVLVSNSKDLLYASYAAPDVWVITPPPLRDLSQSALQGLFEVGYSESQKLSSAFQALADSHSLIVIDTEEILSSGIGADGIHLNKTGHQKLGKAVAQKIRQYRNTKLKDTE